MSELFGQDKCGYEKILATPKDQLPTVCGYKHIENPNKKAAIIIFGAGYHIVNGFRINSDLPKGVVSDKDENGIASVIDPNITVQDVVRSVNSATSVQLREDPVLDRLIDAINLLQDNDFRAETLTNYDLWLNDSRKRKLNALRSSDEVQTLVQEIEKKIERLNNDPTKLLDQQGYKGLLLAFQTDKGATLSKMSEGSGIPQRRNLRRYIHDLLTNKLSTQLETRKHTVMTWLNSLTNVPHKCYITFIRNMRRYDTRKMCQPTFVKPSWVSGIINHINFVENRDGATKVKFVIDIGTKKIALTSADGTQPFEELNVGYAANGGINIIESEEKLDDTVEASMGRYLDQIKSILPNLKPDEVQACFTGKFRDGTDGTTRVEMENALKAHNIKHRVLELAKEGEYGSRHAMMIVEHYYGWKIAKFLVMELGSGSHQGATYKRIAEDELRRRQQRHMRGAYERIE